MKENSVCNFQAFARIRDNTQSSEKKLLKCNLSVHKQKGK